MNLDANTGVWEEIPGFGACLHDLGGFGCEGSSNCLKKHVVQLGIKNASQGSDVDKSGFYGIYGDGGGSCLLRAGN